MRRKLLTVLVSVGALTGVLVGPASASAATLTLYNGFEEPAETADFPNGTGLSINWGVWGCENFDLQAAITENAADPVTLQMTGANISKCKTSGSAYMQYPEIQSPSPITLNADGTGELSLEVTEELVFFWGSLICEREGTLDLTYSEGEVSASGNMYLVSGQPFCPSSMRWETTFAPPLDELGEVIDWVVAP